MQWIDGHPKNMSRWLSIVFSDIVNILKKLNGIEYEKG